jgi:putative thiamine transport system permease protein
MMHRTLLTRPTVLLLTGVSIVPTAAGLIAALWFGLDPGALTRVIATPGIGLSIGSSLWTGGVATALALLLAHLAVAIAVTGNWRRRLTSMVLPLLAMPHLAIGIGLALVLAPSGVLLRLLSPWATGFELPPDWLIVNDSAGISLIIGLVLKETGFLVMALAAALAQVPVDKLQAQSATLGYGPLKGWFATIAPALQQQIRLPLAAVLIFGITNVEMALSLGPGLPPTFSVVLWRWFTDPDPAIHAQAYAGTLVLFAASIAAIAVAAGIGRLARACLLAGAGNGQRRATESGARRAVAGVLLAGWALGALAVVAIGLRAVAGPWRFPALLPTSSSFATLQDLAALTASVGATTLALAGATAIFGLALVLPAAEQCRHSSTTRRHVGALLFLPLLVPQMTFLFGVQVLLVRLNIDGTFVAVLWSHLVFALPYLWGILAPARVAIDPRYEQVAATLGASRATTWLTVTAPLLTRATLLALALAVSVSVSLYLPTLFAGSGRIATAATEAAAAAGSGNLRLAAAHAILLAVIPLAAFAAAFAGGALLFRRRRGVPR